MKFLISLALMFGLCYATLAQGKEDGLLSEDDEKLVITIEVAKQAMNDAIAEFEKPKNKKRLRKALAKIEGDQHPMARMLVAVPIVENIQKKILAKYNFSSVMQAMIAIKQYAQDPEISSGIEKLQAAFSGEIEDDDDDGDDDDENEDEEAQDEETIKQKQAEVAQLIGEAFGLSPDVLEKVKEAAFRDGDEPNLDNIKTMMVKLGVKVSTGSQEPTGAKTSNQDEPYRAAKRRTGKPVSSMEAATALGLDQCAGCMTAIERVWQGTMQKAANADDFTAIDLQPIFKMACSGLDHFKGKTVTDEYNTYVKTATQTDEGAHLQSYCQRMLEENEEELENFITSDFKLPHEITDPMQLWGSLYGRCCEDIIGACNTTEVKSRMFATLGKKQESSTGSEGENSKNKKLSRKKEKNNKNNKKNKKHKKQKHKKNKGASKRNHEEL